MAQLSLSRFPRHRSGFTLVELAIVLVVIGLLTGGILVGRSLIDSSKLNKVITTASQFRMMTETFRNKTGYLPGDAGQSAGIPPNWANLAIGNENGSVVSYENRAVLSHLAMHKIYSGKNPISFYLDNCANGPTDTSIDCWIGGPHKAPGTNDAWQGKSVFMLVNSRDDGGSQVAFDWTTGLAPSATINALYIGYGQGNTQSNQAHSPGAILTPVQGLAIDSKLDDGVATTGSVLGTGAGGGSWLRCLTGTSDGDTYTMDPQYNSEIGCIMLFRVGEGDTFSGARF